MLKSDRIAAEVLIVLSQRHAKDPSELLNTELTFQLIDIVDNNTELIHPKLGGSKELVEDLHKITQDDSMIRSALDLLRSLGYITCITGSDNYGDYYGEIVVTLKGVQAAK